MQTYSTPTNFFAFIFLVLQPILEVQSQAPLQCSTTDLLWPFGGKEQYGYKLVDSKQCTVARKYWTGTTRAYSVVPCFDTREMKSACWLVRATDQFKNLFPHERPVSFWQNNIEIFTVCRMDMPVRGWVGEPPEDTIEILQATRDYANAVGAHGPFSYAQCGFTRNGNSFEVRCDLTDCSSRPAQRHSTMEH